MYFRVYYKATVIKTVWYWHKKQKYRSMEQERKCRDKPTHIWSPYFDKGGKNIQWRKDSLFNKCCWEELQDGGRVGCADHLLPHKYFRNTCTFGTIPIKHLLNAGRRLQTSLPKGKKLPHVPG